MSASLDIRERAFFQLRIHAHRLIAEGYQRMDPPVYAGWKEPDITGELCRHIQEFIESLSAPQWVTRYALRDDPKLNVSGKQGESRPRIDIEFEMTTRGLRPKFRFEAKRLGPQHSVGKYIGPEGMGAFLSGYYPLTHQEAGMLAYIQSHDDQHWSSKIEAALQQNPIAFDLLDACDCFPVKPIIEGLSTHQTAHTISGKRLTIWHTFLLFHQSHG